MALPLPGFLAVCLNFHACMGKRRLLIGGENAHIFPVVSELGTTVETHHICSGLRGRLAAALSWLAGLGEADVLVPASEQSVKDIHNLLPAVALDFLERPSTASLSNLRHYPGLEGSRPPGPIPLLL